MSQIDAGALHDLLSDPQELALIDVREEATFSRGHLLWAICVPLSQLELRIDSLVPRADVRVVLCDEADGLAERAASRLAELGYVNTSVLDGGIAAWAAAGYELFSGVNVPSKAFGEFVEHAYGTPSIDAAELIGLLESGADIAVLDSRPIDEYQLMSIPTGICTPGAELVYRVHEVVPSPDTLVVVNCAGRTRSIIGAQSLINAQIPNEVVALRNGTMGWHLAGLAVEQGSTRPQPDVSQDAIRVAHERAMNVAERFKVQFIDPSELVDLEADKNRTLFLLDVRSPKEFAAGHIPGSSNAPGGQLVQATDTYVGVKGARIVLYDDTETRAIMTASWLVQMGWKDVFVLRGGMQNARLEIGSMPPRVLGLEGLEVEMLSAPSLSRLLDDGRATVIDLSSSRDFRAGHIDGSRHAVRARLPAFLATLDIKGRLVFTSSDGVLARLAARDARDYAEHEPYALMGGNQAWVEAGKNLVAGDSGLEEDPDDVWLRPYEDTQNIEQSMRDYLSWEIDLVAQIERDGTAIFRKWE